MRNQKRFVSHIKKDMNITVEVNYTDSIFHIKEDNGKITHNQIFFDLEDAKEIKKILSEFIIKKEKGENLKEAKTMDTRKDFYLSVQKKDGYFLAFFVDFNRFQYQGLACCYKRLSSVIKFAKKYNFYISGVD